MAERINITVSTALHKRLQVVRDGIGINISRICQEAIEQEVLLGEIKMKGLSTKEEIIERLKIERQKSEEDWFNTGKKDGLEDVKDLTYDDFEQLGELYERKYELERLDLWLNLEQLPENLQEPMQEQMDKYSPKPSEASYLAGWIDGVIEFWDEIKDEI